MKFNYLETSGYEHPLSPELVRLANERIRWLEDHGRLPRNRGTRARALFSERTGAISIRIGNAEFPLSVQGFVGKDGHLYIQEENPYGADDPARAKSWQLGCHDGSIGVRVAQPKNPAYRRGWEAGSRMWRGRAPKREHHLVTIGHRLVGLPGNIIIAGLIAILLFT